MKVAVVQRAPILLDLRASLELSATMIRLAAKESAQLVVFPEAYIGGYPAWVWRLRAHDDARLLARLYRDFVDNAVDLEAGELDLISEAARKAGVTVVIGFNEIARSRGATTVYNAVAVLDGDGAILNVHRKLMPTGPERTIWGRGDAQGLRVVETGVGRVGALICWKNYMPLARWALYAQGIDILVAPTWDHDDSWAASMRHIAKEGGCWVISTATSLRAADLQDGLPGRTQWAGGDEWICRGEALVVRPFGSIVAGPLPPEQPVLYADIDLGAVTKARRMIDIAGHYARPDIFGLTVDRRPRAAATFVDRVDAHDAARETGGKQ